MARMRHARHGRGGMRACPPTRDALAGGEGARRDPQGLRRQHALQRQGVHRPVLREQPARAQGGWSRSASGLLACCAAHILGALRSLRRLLACGRSAAGSAAAPSHTQTLEEPGHGRVLVVDGGGSKRCALLGDNIAEMAYKNGWSVSGRAAPARAAARGRACVRGRPPPGARAAARPAPPAPSPAPPPPLQGILINGCIRDSEDIGKMPLGVKALATYPLKSSKRDPGLREVQVTIAGVTVSPGDYLYADQDGVLVSPEELKL
jgi:regulator of ribonuclease activity A